MNLIEFHANRTLTREHKLVLALVSVTMFAAVEFIGILVLARGM